MGQYTKIECISIYIYTQMISMYATYSMHRNFSVNTKLYIPLCITVALHPTGLQALHLPSLDTEERAWSQRHRHQWFNGWRSLHVLEQHSTVCSRQWAGHGSSLCSQGSGRLPVIGGIDIRLAHRLPGKQAGARPSPSL